MELEDFAKKEKKLENTWGSLDLKTWGSFDLSSNALKC